MKPILASFWSINTLGCWMIVLFPIVAVGTTIIHILAIASPRSVARSIEVCALLASIVFAVVAIATLREMFHSPMPVRSHQIMLMLTVPPTVLAPLAVYRMFFGSA